MIRQLLSDYWQAVTEIHSDVVGTIRRALTIGKTLEG